MIPYPTYRISQLLVYNRALGNPVDPVRSGGAMLIGLYISLPMLALLVDVVMVAVPVLPQATLYTRKATRF